MSSVTMYADGGARGNPGLAGWGAVVSDSATGAVLAFDGARVAHATNNFAEYSGLLLGLNLAASVGAHDVTVRMDSKLVVEQMKGRWKVKNPDLAVLHASAKAQVEQFESVTFEWIPRDQNAQADHLANLAMDGRKMELPDEVRAGMARLSIGTADYAVVYARGYRPSPSSDAALAVCLFEDGGMTAQRTKYLPGRSWTGIAEYRAAIAGLELAAERGARAVEIVTSSQLLFDQMTGKRAILGQEFLLRASRIDVLSESFSAVHWDYVTATENPADAFAREAFAAGHIDDKPNRLRSGSYGTNGRISY